MFLRCFERRKNGKVHSYWALVELNRTGRGSRQRVELDQLLERLIPRGRAEDSWAMTAAILAIARYRAALR